MSQPVIVRPKWLRPNRDGTPWYTRVFRITTIRIVSQTFFFALFIFLLWSTWFSRLGGYPVSLFLEADPLVGLTTALGTGHLYHEGTTGLLLGALILILTVFLGRAFCGWICPFGTLHHLTHWLGFPRRAKARITGRKAYVASAGPSSVHV